MTELFVYFFCFFLSFILSLFFTAKVRRLALRYNIIDAPTEDRKIQKGHVPLLGGLAVYLSFSLVVIFLWLTGWLNRGGISHSQIIAIISGGFILSIVGFFDDKYNLCQPTKSRHQLVTLITDLLMP